MRYKLLGLFLILLISAPLYGQEVSPVMVDTLQPTPTTVKTGEFFVQLYRLRFLDLADEGLEITINENNLGFGTLGEFEVVDFCVDKGESDGLCAGLGGGNIRKDFLERTWYLQYTLRIVGPKKSTYKIPPITVYWTQKKIGQTADQAETKSFESQNEVYINYVTTLTEDPNLTYRDGIDFGSFSQRAFVYRSAFWFFLVFVPTLWLVWLVAYFRSPAVEPNLAIAGTSADEIFPADLTAYKPISRRKAFTALRKKIAKLNSLALNRGNFIGLEIRAELVESIMDLLSNLVPGSSVGTTPAQMERLVNKEMFGTSNGAALSVLAGRARQYQNELEVGVDAKFWSLNPGEDAMFLKKNLSQFRWYARFYNYLFFQYLNFLSRFRRR